MVRADSGFAREAPMAWREANGVDYLLGLARNPRPAAEVETEPAVAACGSLRLKPLKIGAWVRVAVRRVKIAMNAAHPFQREFRIACERLSAAAA